MKMCHNRSWVSGVGETEHCQMSNFSHIYGWHCHQMWQITIQAVHGCVKYWVRYHLNQMEKGMRGKDGYNSTVI